MGKHMFHFVSLCLCSMIVMTMYIIWYERQLVQTRANWLTYQPPEQPPSQYQRK